MNSNSRPTIGLLTCGITHPVSQALWHGVAGAARAGGANLICFPGGVLRSPQGFDAQANVLYELAGAENVDGLVVWGGVLAYHVGAQEARTFCERYRPLPLVSIALTLPGSTSLSVDNYGGMREAVTHLLEEHGHRRIAFIRGPAGHPEAKERYRAYADALAAYDVPLDDHLVAQGDFSNSGGAAAIESLLEHRNLRPGDELEAVVAVNDAAAIGALMALQERGLHVPGEVAVVGFDGIQQAKYLTPPLTTVLQPHFEMGQQAVELLLAQLQGQETPEQVLIPSRLMVRQSCGCMSPQVARAAAHPPRVTARGESFQEALAARRDDIVSAMAQAVAPADTDSAGVERLLDAFCAGLAERGASANAFLQALEGILRQVVADEGDVSAWQGALSALRLCSSPYLEAEALPWAEDLWSQGRVMVGELAQQAQAHQALQSEQQANTLREIGQALITTFDVAELMDVLVQQLPRLDIPSCYFSLYDTSSESRLILAFDETGRAELDDGGRRFSSPELAPSGILPQERPYSLVLEPLYFNQDRLGLALFEVGPQQGEVYEALRGQISSALKGALLMQERQQMDDKARRRMQEQTMLFDVGQELSSAPLQPEKIAEIVVRQFVQAMGVDECSLSLLNEQRDALHIIVNLFIDEERGVVYEEYGPEVDYLADYPSTARAMEALQPLVTQISDPDADPGELAYMREYEVMTSVSLPLAVKGQAIGIIELEEHDEERHYSEEEIALAMTLASQAAAALDNARLYEELQQSHAEVEQQVVERTAELQQETARRERLQQDVIAAQEQAIRELSTPVIPLIKGILIMPLVGSVDDVRAKDIMRALLAGIRAHGAKIVILDITGVPLVDSGVANYLNKTIQAARLKGAHTIITGISEDVAEAIVDLGIDWSDIETLSDLQTGLKAALSRIGLRIVA